MSRRYGYNTYAGNLRYRVITLAWRTWGAVVGRMYYEPIRLPDDQGYNWVVGMQMRWRNTRHSRGYHVGDTPGEWVFQAYFDGIAFFRPYQIYGVFNRPTYNSIVELIRSEYNLEREVQTDKDDYVSSVHVYRRKLLSPMAKTLYNKSLTFGDFLASKYNIQTEQEVSA